MSDSEAPMPRPSDPVGEHERQATIQQIQGAMADGDVEFEELDDRFAQVYRAETRAELAAVVADLPQRPRPAPRSARWNRAANDH